MKPFLAALMLSAAALAPTTAFAAAPVAATVADANLDKLVALMAPEDAISRLAGKAFDAGMDEQLAADPKMKASFDANPGLRDQVGGELRTQFTTILVAALPSLRVQLGAILQQELTTTEVADTLAFFASPTGQKLRAEVYETMGSAPGQSPAEVQQAAIAAVMQKMTAEDYPALMAFGASPAAQKMGTINPKLTAASKAWAEKLVADNRSKMQALAVKLTADYLASKGTK
jgi:hypothetical protein